MSDERDRGRAGTGQRSTDRDGAPPDARFRDEPPVWAAVSGFEGCVDWPGEDSWATATRPPAAGERQEVAVSQLLVFGGEGFIWAGRRALSAQEAALIARGSDLV